MLTFLSSCSFSSLVYLLTLDVFDTQKWIKEEKKPKLVCWITAVIGVYFLYAFRVYWFIDRFCTLKLKGFPKASLQCPWRSYNSSSGGQSFIHLRCFSSANVVARSYERLHERRHFHKKNTFFLLDVPRDSGRAKTFCRVGVALKNGQLSLKWRRHFREVAFDYLFFIDQFSHDMVRYPPSLNLLPVLLI